MDFISNITEFNASNATVISDYLSSGRMAEAVFGTYHGLIGYGTFVILIYAVLLGLLYIKTRSLGMVSIVSLFFTTATWVVLPSQLAAILAGITALTIGALIYTVWRKPNG